MADRTDIISLPHPSLTKASKPVKDFDSKELEKLVKRMESATLDWEQSRDHEVGVALAAVQIDDLRQAIIIRRDSSDPDNHEFDIYINPEITRFEGEPKAELEGCLSVPDLYAKIPRYPKVKVKAQNIHGKTVKLYARGFLARIFQHEIDHTHGLTFVNKLGPTAQYYRIGEGSMQPLTSDERDQLMSKWGVVDAAED